MKDVAKNKVDTTNSIVVTQVDRNTMQSTHSANRNLPTLSSAAKIGHVIPNLSSASLLSIVQLYDDNFLTLFTKGKVFIFKQNKVLLKEKRNYFTPQKKINIGKRNILEKRRYDREIF